LLLKGKGKGKVHPIRGHEGPEAEERYHSTLSLTPAALPLEETQHPLYRRVGGPQGQSGGVLKIPPPPPPGFDHRTIQPVVSSNTCH